MSNSLDLIKKYQDILSESDREPQYTKQYPFVQNEDTDMGISKKAETRFHAELDDLVHSTFGKRKGELDEDDNSFAYRLLGRLKADCDYFLGAGSRSEKGLWAGNVPDQIEKMKELYKQLPEDKKPDWLSMIDIEKYAQAMEE